MEIIHSGYVLGPESFTSRVGILRDSDILDTGLGIGVAEREISGLSGSDSGLGFRVGTFDALWDRVTARLLPRLGVLECFSRFGVLGKSSGNRLLLDPPLIYDLIIDR